MPIQPLPTAAPAAGGGGGGSALPRRAGAALAPDLDFALAAAALALALSLAFAFGAIRFRTKQSALPLAVGPRWQNGWAEKKWKRKSVVARRRSRHGRTQSLKDRWVKMASTFMRLKHYKCQML